MNGVLKSRTFAAALVVVGLAVFLFGFARAWALESVDRNGVFEIGHVTAVSDRDVTLSYERQGKQFDVTAYPKVAGDFTVGDVVQIKVVLDGGRLAVIDRTKSSTGFYLGWLGLGAALVAVGGLRLLLLWKGRPVVEPLAPIQYAGRRHGGA